MHLQRLLLFVLAISLNAGTAAAQPAVARSAGAMLYLPIYSHIWHGDVDSRGRATKTLVSILVSIRNTDPSQSLRITSAAYYDTEGLRIKDYVPVPILLRPMATHEIFVPRSDDRGGSGANFVVIWKADAPVSPPMVEGVHANLPAARSIAFITTARVIPSE